LIKAGQQWDSSGPTVTNRPLAVKDSVLLDARNRCEARQRAGVEPHVAELNGMDPAAYVLSANVSRRHLTKSQRAMAVAKLYPEAPPVARDSKGRRLTKDDPGKNERRELTSRGKSSDRYLQEPRVVLACPPEAADAVLAGTLPLPDTYAQAVKIRDARDSDQTRLQLLRECSPISPI
jgi:hypothetical protein